MPKVYESASRFSPQANTEPDLLVIEMTFIKDGKAQPADNDLAVKLFNVGENVQIGLDITFASSPPILRKVSGGGFYYFVRIDPVLFDGSIEARWYAKLQGIPFDPYPVISYHNAAGSSERILLSSEVRDWTLRKLGWPKVSVELSEAHIAECIDDVLNVYNRWIPKLKYGEIDILSGKKYYSIPTSGRGIIDVQFRRKEGNPMIADPMFGRDYPRYTRIDFDNYVLSSSHFETLLRNTGQEPIWRWEPSDPLTLFINIGDNGRSFYKCSYCYVTDHRIEEINPAHHDLFKRMVLARTKQILGEIRGKFANSIVTPSGNVETNGGQLKSEGSEEYERLVEDLIGLQPAMWPIRG